MIRSAKFQIGDWVKHEQFGYMAVIVDIDPVFQASGRYNPQASKRPFTARNPWYRLLVDDSNQITYVEECHLARIERSQPIDNPGIDDFLVENEGRYELNKKSH